MPPDDSFRGRASDQYQPCLSTYQQHQNRRQRGRNLPAVKSNVPSPRTVPSPVTAIAHAIDCRERYFGTHLFQIARQQNHPAGWSQPMRHPDRAAGECRAEEWSRVRQVGPNGHLSAVALRAVQPSMCGRIRRPQPHRRHRSHRPRSCEWGCGRLGSSPCARCRPPCSLD